MRHRTAGFSLVEVVLALGIIAFAILAIIGLLPLGFELAQNAREDIHAVNLISVISSDLRDTPMSEPKSPALHLSPLPWVPDEDTQAPIVNTKIVTSPDYTYYATDGQRISLSMEPDTRYRISLRYIAPDDGQSVLQALAVISWPASLDPFDSTPGAPPVQGKVETLLTFPRPAR